MLSAHQPRRIVLVSGSDTGDAEYLRLIDEVLQSQRDELLQIQRRVLDEPHIEVSMVALVSGLRMLFATGAAYGRKVAALHKPCMPALLRMISPLTMRLLPKPGKSSSTTRHRLYASRKIGRAACRARGRRYVKIRGVAGL